MIKFAQFVSIKEGKMTVYPEMNNKIVELLRMGGTPVEFYAAQRIEELELKNKELIDRVLAVIDEVDEEYMLWHGIIEIIRDRVKVLKGEQG